MSIDIRHVAKLAKLRIEDSEIAKFEKEMEDIIAMVEKLPPMEGQLKLDEDDCMDLRKDSVQPSLRRDEAIGNAPKKQAGCVVVPRTVE